MPKIALRFVMAATMGEARPRRQVEVFRETPLRPQG